MPFLFAGFGLAIGLYLVLEWWANASTASAKKALVWCAVAIALLLAVALFSRAGPSFAVLPILFTGFRLLNIGKRIQGLMHSAGYRPDWGGTRQTGGNPQITRAEALDILGLSGNPTSSQINKRYKALISKAHPDAGGSEWLASRVNAARDVLLTELDKNQ